ncbi:hypothetical protein LIER_05481 [Lithospermum erythrorhizon]|uniref:Transposase n=1 Tax=Lithospermum erythrorhizon TaxID=34254 RepID=A0AAV3P0U4_LITER
MKRAMSLVNIIFLTTNLWWSGEQKIGYMGVTGEVLARELLRVMDDWHIREKVISISVDNTSSNDNCIARLKVDFSNRRNLALEGQLFHVRCCAYILNILVQDGLDVIKPCVDNIRNGVRYLLNSKTRCKAFKKIVDELGLEGRLQGLDTKTRWNSTWLNNLRH